MLKYVVSPDCWDEAACYLQRGIELVIAHRNPFAFTEEGPLYACWYALLYLFQKDALKLYYFNGQFLCFILPILIYGFCRRARLSSSSAFLSASAFMLFPPLVTIARWPNHFSLAIALIGFGIALPLKRRESFLGVACLTTGLMSFVRPENQISFFTFLAALIISLFISRKTWRQQKIAFASLVMSVPILILWLTKRQSTDLSGPSKSLYVFMDYTRRRYNGTAMETGEWSALFYKLYGPIKSVMQAPFINPSDFLAHLIYNGKIFVRLLVGMVATYNYLTVTAFGAIFICMVFAVGIFSLLKQKDTQDANEHLNQIHLLRIIAVTAAAIIPVIAANTLFGPTPRYLLPIIALICIFPFAFFRRDNKLALSLSAVAMLVAVFFLQPNFDQFENTHFFYGVDLASEYKHFDHMADIMFLRELKTTEPKIAYSIGDTGVALYANVSQTYRYCWNQAMRCPESASDDLFSFDDFIRHLGGPNVVLVDASFRETIYSYMLPSHLRDEMRSFLLTPEHFGFVAVPIPCTPYDFYVRKSILSPDFSRLASANSIVKQLGCDQN